MNFNELGLSSELLRALDAQGYASPTPIQEQAIPIVLDGRDLLAGAQTGTGKTAGFTLPLLQRLSTTEPRGRSRRKPVRALILTPTRELAAQVGESVQTYGKHLPFTSAVIFGGVNINPQIAALRRGVDIVIATPGRLLDHAGQKTIDLSDIEILVLDEADRMLDMGFIHDIKRVLKLLPAKRQNLLFSATFSDEIRALAQTLLNSPEQIQIARRNAPAEAVNQVVHPVDAARKRELLSHMIGANDWRQVLVFTRTKHGANRLSEKLCRDGLTAAAIHGNKSQGARTRALDGFKSGQVRVLVATDIAARGLDIDQLPHVVNFELPSVPEDYVHRIGRTGRAGASGEAVSLVSADEGKLLSAIERLLGRELDRIIVPGYETNAALPRFSPSSPRGQAPAGHRKPREAGQGKPRSPAQGKPRAPGQSKSRSAGQAQPVQAGQGKPRSAGQGKPVAGGQGKARAAGHGKPRAAGHGQPGAPSRASVRDTRPGGEHAPASEARGTAKRGAQRSTRQDSQRPAQAAAAESAAQPARRSFWGRLSALRKGARDR